jgi:hypothetical protein
VEKAAMAADMESICESCADFHRFLIAGKLVCPEISPEISSGVLRDAFPCSRFLVSLEVDAATDIFPHHLTLLNSYEIIPISPHNNVNKNSILHKKIVLVKPDFL